MVAEGNEANPPMGEVSYYRCFIFGRWRVASDEEAVKTPTKIILVLVLVASLVGDGK